MVNARTTGTHITGFPTGAPVPNEFLTQRNLLDAMGVAVYTTDADGRITMFNEAAVEMWGRRPIVGEDLWCGSWKIYTTDGEYLPHDQCPMAVTLKENRPVRGVEAIAERPDGSRIFFMPFPTPLQDETGRLVGAVNVLVDVTERRMAEEKAQAAIRESLVMKDQFLGLVSHELRTPIATIVGECAADASPRRPADRGKQASGVGRRGGRGTKAAADH